MKITKPVQDQRFHNIPCVMLKTLINEGLLEVGPNGEIDLDHVKDVMKLIGSSKVVAGVLANGGAKASPAELIGSSGKALNIYGLRGSDLDHKSDTQIYRDPKKPGGFDADRFVKLAEMSSDGERLTVKDLALANKLYGKEEDGSFRDIGLGMAELGALLMAIGTRGEDGVMGMDLNDVLGMYRDFKLPDHIKPNEGQTNSIGLIGLVVTLAKMAFHRTFTVNGRAQAGFNQAVGRETALVGSSLEGIRKALCPAGGRPMVSPPANQPDLAALHDPKPADETRAS